MNPNAFLYALVLSISAVISTVTAYFAWKRRKRSAAALPLAILMVSMTAWSLPYALYWLASTSAERMFWIDASYAGVVAVPGAFFFFALAYSNLERWLTRRRLLLLCVEPILCCLLLWTDKYHHLFTAGKRVADATAIKDGGIGYWGNFIYSYILLILGFVILVRFFITAQKPYRRQTGTVMLAALIPWAANIVSIFQNVQYGIDPTSSAFTFTGLIITYSLFYHDLLDLVPVARGKVIEIMQESMIVTDEKGRIVDVNPAANRLLCSIGGASAIGHPITQFFSEWAMWAGNSLPANTPIEVEIEQNTIRRAYEIAISPLLDKRGKSYGQVLILHDVTERKRIEEALKQSLEYHRAVFDSVNDGIFIYDADIRQIVDVNARMCEMHGYTREEIIGSPGTEKFNAGIEHYNTENAGQKMLLARTEGPQTFEWLGKHKTNGTFWLEVRVRRALIGGSERFIVSSNDITIRKLAQERALDLVKERDRIDILKRFITNTSHDFRTPLSTIGTSAYLLTKDTSVEKQKRHQHVIQEQITRLIGIMDDFLNAAQLDADSRRLTIRPLDANDLIGDIISIQAVEACQKAQQLVFEPDRQLGLIAADQKALEQVVRQLITNALHYTLEHGTITVSTYAEAGYGVIEVADTGIGIAAADLPRIFEHFFRADSARSTATGGAGLGLSITKRLVDVMRGRIEVESKLEQGSCFRVKLPLATAQPAFRELVASNPVTNEA